MSMDAIQQSARAIADAMNSLSELEQHADEEAKKKSEQLRKYILSLSRRTQKYIDEEREHAE